MVSTLPKLGEGSTYELLDAPNLSFEVPEGLQFRREGLSMPSQLSGPGINFDSVDMEVPFEVPEDLCFERRGLSVCQRRRPSPLNPTLKGW